MHLQRTIRPELAATVSRRAALLAFGLVAGFLVILAALHFVEPEFDPSWRWISEYQLGDHGWLMSVAFFLWGAGALTLSITLWPSLRTRAGRVGRWWFLLSAVALFGAGTFVTDPITATEPTTAGTLHTVFGMCTILTFPVMATLVVRGLLSNPEWVPARRRLLWTTALTWIAPLSFWGAIVVSTAVNHAEGPGPDVLAGWPNRLMAVSYGVWIMTVAWQAASTAGPGNPRGAG